MSSPSLESSLPSLLDYVSEQLLCLGHSALSFPESCFLEDLGETLSLNCAFFHTNPARSWLLHAAISSYVAKFGMRELTRTVGQRPTYPTTSTSTSTSGAGSGSTGESN